MTIRSKNDDEDMVTLPSIWSVLLKIQIAALIPMFLLGVSWATWITTGWWKHDTRLALLERDAPRSQHSQSTNVNVGAADAASDSTTRREFLTTQEVAAMESVSERTISDWISRGIIEPAPVKAGKEWQISAKYRILPHNADILRNTAQTK